MSRMMQYIKLLILSWFTKGKVLCRKLWNRMFPPEVEEELDDIIFVSSKKYDNLFSDRQTTDEILVSEKDWDQIKNSIYDGYVLPNAHSINLLTSMKADAYNTFFHNPPLTPNLFVDREIWGKVNKNLRENYQIPTPLLEKVMRPMNSEFYDNLFSQSYGTPKVFVDNRVWEQLIKNLPDSYSLPDHSPITSILPQNAMPSIVKHKFK